MKKILFLLALLGIQTQTYAQYTGTGSVSQGLATTTTSNLYPGCTGGRVSAIGTISSTDGKVWTVPAVTQFTTGTHCADLYNQCTGVTPATTSAIDLSAVPTVVIDPAGVTITGYVFCDNYFELYVNGTLVGVDPVPYTPFNTNVVKFKVSYPYTLALKLVDWEENLGLGTEANGGNPYHAGDGGFIAKFSDGTVTDASWKAQSYYIAPIEDLTKVVELADGTRSSSAASTSPSCNGTCYAIHYAVPTNWNATTYSDAGWPNATTYTDATVGVTAVTGYTSFPTLWSGAQFIWSSNLILDNEVLVRRIVSAPAKVAEAAHNDDGISIYPNPATKTISLIFTGAIGANDISRLSLYNTLGNKLLDTFTYTNNIDVSEIPKGVYFLKIDCKGQQITRVISIQ